MGRCGWKSHPIFVTGKGNEEGTMNDELVVRAYDVGFGDCIYVQIPDKEGCFHMMIDCGTSGSAEVLKAALDDMRADLPKEDGKRRLDLLVVTHPHADHIKGFNPAWFKDVMIKRVWLGVFMDKGHPEAKGMQAFQDLTSNAARGLLERGLALSPGVRALLERNISNTDALAALRTGIPQASGIQAKYPLYVARDVAERKKPKERESYDLTFEKGTTCFHGFKEDGTCLRILAPEWDIDKWYLGKGSLENRSLVDQYLYPKGASGATLETPTQPGPEAAEAGDTPVPGPKQPDNVSARDFRQLRHRLLYSGLAFSQTDDSLKNNTSVVLLLEWRGKRLLFAGDAEWQGSGVKEGRRNSTWDVMLSIPKVKQQLLKEPVHLLKVAHHGSHNGTPFVEGEKEQEVLGQLLSADRSHVVVSTVTGVHGREMPVPYAPLLEELGRLAYNKRRYPDAREEELRDKHQPQRTDLEPPIPGKKVRYVEVRLKPA
jgi:beta-lactamase superfamily II metal-dependent hydrolase